MANLIRFRSDLLNKLFVDFTTHYAEKVVAVNADGTALGSTGLVAEDTAHVSGDTGRLALAVRSDNNATTFTTTAGDYSPISVSPRGELYVIQAAGNGVGASGTTAHAEDAAAGSGDLGVFSLSVRRDADGTTTGADGDYSEFQTDSRGSLRTVSVQRAATSTLTNVNNSASSVTVLAANVARRGATIYNDDTAISGAVLKIKFGATASSTSFTVAIQPAGYFEVPFGYTGIIDGIASAATGTARVTELT